MPKSALLELPFGFKVSIDQIQNDFNLVATNGQPVAGLSTVRALFHQETQS